MDDSSQMWSEYSSTATTAKRGWQVTGATTDEEARLATPLPGTNPIPTYGDTHSENSLLVCYELPVDPDGPNLRIVRALYKIPQGSGFENPNTIGTKRLIPQWGQS